MPCLVGANQVDVEKRQTTYKPDCYEAVCNENNRENIARHSTPQSSMLPENIKPRKYKHIYAQSGWRSYKAYEIWIVALQADQHRRSWLVSVKKQLLKQEKQLSALISFLHSKHELERWLFVDNPCVKEPLISFQGIISSKSLCY